MIAKKSLKIRAPDKRGFPMIILQYLLNFSTKHVLTPYQNYLYEAVLINMGDEM